MTRSKIKEIAVRIFLDVNVLSSSMAIKAACRDKCSEWIRSK
jgi:hypothetical protein